MSSEAAAAEEMLCCANCGISAIDDVELKDWDGGCDLVKYCSNECQNNDRPQHDEECKKRLIEIRDRNLFTMPEGSNIGECPICCLPLPIDPSKSTMSGCCSKMICNGCDYANQNREYESGLQQRCAFCREPVPNSEEFEKKRMERVKKNCPAAMCHMGKERYHEGDYETAFKYLTKAAELGDVDAHHNLSCLYRKGEGVEKDAEKSTYLAEEAAIGGHPGARHNLGIHEGNNGNFERARKHWIIAANLGYDDSLKCIKDLYAKGHASKEDYANALRAYQAAVDATKSAEREKAEAAKKNGELKLSF